MNLKSILLIIIFLSLFIDSTIVSLPIVFAISILYYILFPNSATVFFLIFLMLILDVLRVIPLGLSSVALSVSFISIYLVRTFAEISDTKVVGILIFIITLIYARIAEYSTNLFIYTFIFLICSLLFIYFSPKKTKFRKTDI